jgi:transcriptional regulator with XRE-family HTH domain
MDTHVGNDFWDRVLFLLYEHNLKQSDLARALNKKTGWLSASKERKSIPQADTACAIAKILNTTVEFLVTGDDWYSKEFGDETELQSAFRAIQRSRVNSKIVCQLPLLNLSQQEIISSMIDAMGIENPYEENMKDDSSDMVAESNIDTKLH